MSQRSPGGIDQHITPAVQPGGFREPEDVVHQGICRDFQKKFGASRVRDSVGSEDGAQGLLSFEHEEFRVLWEMLQMDLAGPKSHGDLAPFRDQDHLA